jgi:hypothetical protein
MNTPHPNFYLLELYSEKLEASESLRLVSSDLLELQTALQSYFRSSWGMGLSLAMGVGQEQWLSSVVHGRLRERFDLHPFLSFRFPLEELGEVQATFDKHGKPLFRFDWEGKPYLWSLWKKRERRFYLESSPLGEVFFSVVENTEEIRATNDQGKALEWRSILPNITARRRIEKILLLQEELEELLEDTFSDQPHNVNVSLELSQTGIAALETPVLAAGEASTLEGQPLVYGVTEVKSGRFWTFAEWAKNVNTGLSFKGM